ncbi:DUF3140 domain-containing protein [Streptomyces sp. C3-3]|uniref:DUF3140 domain-containing protein n=1 Tax=Streptomyces sp. C3-3 TaxID=2824901 RepID=UPI001B36D4C6|nr:DUF3140 domain-containing protein [Streptomyces sp. C3-3]MBQ1116502.1 DUF3140 domain-containing protein [Streptomyces sp. C3-3]
MTAGELEKWLDTEWSRKVGQKEGSGESTGHASVRLIIKLRRTRQNDLSYDDLEHMRKVTGYVRRHAEQRPEGDVSDTRWRHSLMNWGHDLKK